MMESTLLRVPLPADVAYDSFVERAEFIVFAPPPEYQHDFRALMAAVVNFMFFAMGLTGVSCRVRDVHVDSYNIIMHVYREKGRAGRRGPDDLRVLLLLVWATNSDVVLDYIDPNVLPSPGAWFFFGHITPLRHFQVQQDSATEAFTVPLS
eukprot:jgi/Tetstr1/461153/TSEL_006290.t1